MNQPITFIGRLKVAVIAPFRMIAGLAAIPLVIMIACILATQWFSYTLSNLLLTFIGQMARQHELPDWSVPNLVIAVKIIPILICLPLLFAAPSYGFRLGFIEGGHSTLMQNIKMFWYAVTKSAAAYAHSWKILPWYCIPLLSVLLTLRLAPYFIPQEYTTFFDGLVLLLSLLSIYRIFPIIFSPLTASLGMYNPYHSIEVTREVFRIAKFDLYVVIAAWIAAIAGVLQLDFVTTDWSTVFCTTAVISAYAMAVLSGIFVQIISMLETAQRR